MTTATNTFANFDFQRFSAFCSRNGMNFWIQKEISQSKAKL